MIFFAHYQKHLIAHVAKTCLLLGGQVQSGKISIVLNSAGLDSIGNTGKENFQI